MQFIMKDTNIPPYIPYARFLLDFPLSETARLVYSLILSRIQLSLSRQWVDDQNRVFCRYTIQSLMEDTGKSKTTIVHALAELESQGLLYRHRAGAGYANRLYLRLPENVTSEDPKTVPQSIGKLTTSKYKNNIKNNIKNYEYTGDSL